MNRARRTPHALLPRCRAAGLGSALCLLAACGGGTPAAAVPFEARPGAEQRPPRVAQTEPWSFPRPSRARLDNGLELQLLERPGAPLAELRLVVRSGTASDEARPGVAALTAAALEAGAGRSRELERVESVGGRLKLELTRDALSIGLTLPRAALSEGLALLAAFTAPPRWSALDFERLRRRQLARVRALLADDPSWLADMALYAELFRASPRHHPYERFDVLPSELERPSADDCSRWHAQQFSPRNAFLLVVADSSLALLAPLAQQAFGAWQGEEVPAPAFFAPPEPTRVRALLVDRPQDPEVELRVATLAPERRDASWPKLALLGQLLGAGQRSRARLALEQLGEPEPRVSAQLEEVAYGETPLVLSARIGLERAPRALGALLEAFGSLAARAPEARELRGAAGQLSARLLEGLEAGASAADLLSRAGTSALPEGALEAFRAELGRIGAEELRSTAARLPSAPPIVVAVGDAARLVAPLSRFGQVHVLNSTDDFRVERVVSQDPTAPLDLPSPER